MPKAQAIQINWQLRVTLVLCRWNTLLIVLEALGLSRHCRQKCYIRAVSYERLHSSLLKYWPWVARYLKSSTPYHPSPLCVCVCVCVAVSFKTVPFLAGRETELCWWDQCWFCISSVHCACVDHWLKMCHCDNSTATICGHIFCTHHKIARFTNCYEWVNES